MSEHDELEISVAAWVLGAMEVDEVEMMRDVAMYQRSGGHHLGVEKRARADEAQEKPAMAVGPIHHRRDA